MFSSETALSLSYRIENGRTKSRRDGIMDFAAGAPVAGASGQDLEETESLYS